MDLSAVMHWSSGLMLFFKHNTVKHLTCYWNIRQKDMRIENKKTNVLHVSAVRCGTAFFA